MTNKNLTEIVCLVDRSGSMNSVREDAIGGFNAFLKGQKESKHGDCYLTYVQFDGGGIDTIHEQMPIQNVPELTPATFVPRGSTPLLEAMCRTIDSVGTRLANLKEDSRPGNVVFVVLTDGQENASGRDFTRDLLKEKIRVQTDDYDWSFVFLAQNIDAFAAGRDIGIDMSNKKHLVAKACAGGQGAAQIYHATSAAVNNARSKARRGMDIAYSVSDKEEFCAGAAMVKAEDFVLSSTEDFSDTSSTDAPSTGDSSSTDSSAE